MRECQCDMRTKLVGDGCDICNPELALDHARDEIAELQHELDICMDALRKVADIAHHGGLIGLKDITTAFNCIRKITLPWWSKEESDRIQRKIK